MSEYNEESLSPVIPYITHKNFAKFILSPVYQQILERNNNNDIIDKGDAERTDHSSYAQTVCYSDDIFKHLKSVEQNRTIFDISSEFISYRSYLVNVLKYFVKKCGLSNLTLHSSIYILDTFLSKYQISNEEMQLTAITCFLVAAKFEEEESKVPSIFHLNVLNEYDEHNTQRQYSLREYRIFEARVLQSTEFNLAMPTVATFANFFSRTSVTLEDFHAYQRSGYDEMNPSRASNSSHGLFGNYEDMRTHVNNLLFQLIDTSAGVLFFLNVLPSKTAAACLAASRLLYNIQPIWTIYLECQTEYKVSDILPFAEMIVNVYEVNFLDSIKDPDSPGAASANTDHNYSLPPLDYAQISHFESH